MRTTIDIHDPLLERAKLLAARLGKNLSEVVNDALTEKLSREESPPAVAGGFQMLTYGMDGTQPGVDLNSSQSIETAMEVVQHDSGSSAVHSSRSIGQAG
jgi:hypothetical protein